MQGRYFVRCGDGSLISFYHVQSKGVLYRINQRGKWQPEKLLLENGQKNFSVCFEKNKILVFCQDNNGNVMLYQGNGDNWRGRVILNNQSDKVHRILFSPIISETAGKAGLCLVYNMPAAEGDGHYLVKQHLSEGKWDRPERLDKVTRLNNELYNIQYISHDHCVLFYQTKSAEYKLGYREVTSAAHGAFHLIHSSAYQVTGHSFLVTDSEIHVLYIIRNMFGSQLLYKKKNNTDFSAPLVIFEGQRIENCLLSIINDNIYVHFQSAGQMYQCISDDKGESFSRPRRYRHKICESPVKAIYLSEAAQKENQFFCREVYVDENNSWDVQILPDLYEDFYLPLQEVKQAVPPSPAAVPGPSHEQAPPREQNKEPDEAFWLKTKLSVLENQVRERDDRIRQLTAMLEAEKERS